MQHGNWPPVYLVLSCFRSRRSSAPHNVLNLTVLKCVLCCSCILMFNLISSHAVLNCQKSNIRFILDCLIFLMSSTRGEIFWTLFYLYFRLLLCISFDSKRLWTQYTHFKVDFCVALIRIVPQIVSSTAASPPWLTMGSWWCFVTLGIMRDIFFISTFMLYPAYSM